MWFINLLGWVLGILTIIWLSAIIFGPIFDGVGSLGKRIKETWKKERYGGKFIR